MITDQLWGGTLKAARLDASTQTVGLVIIVSSGGMSRSFELLLSGVSQFQFFNNIAGSWEYAEFTEFRAARDESTGHWAFDIVLWSEDAGMSGKCVTVSLDGTELAASP